MSIIRADNVGPSAGGTVRELVRGTAAAWANLKGTGTIATRDSLNISSVTDLGTGSYRYNFTNSLANSNGSATTGNSDLSLPRPTSSIGSITSTNVAQATRGVSGGTDTLVDATYAMVQVMGSLA